MSATCGEAAGFSWGWTYWYFDIKMPSFISSLSAGCDLHYLFVLPSWWCIPRFVSVLMDKSSEVSFISIRLADRIEEVFFSGARYFSALWRGYTQTTAWILKQTQAAVPSPLKIERYTIWKHGMVDSCRGKFDEGIREKRLGATYVFHSK